MNQLLHINDQDLLTTHDIQQEFINAVDVGLQNRQKNISSQYLYDPQGCELFNQITRHPDYYLTQCELEIIKHNKQKLAKFFHHTSFNLVELGPGEGIKTQLFLQEFCDINKDFAYLPIDISAEYLKKIIQQIKTQKLPIDITALHSDYFTGLKWLSDHSDRQNIILFLGSAIGNFKPVATRRFLRHMWQALHPNDYVLIGFDLRKNIDTLMRAYNDAAGLTRSFNLNLLQRINKELQGDFVLDQFEHYATYNVHTGAMESYLVSLEPQTVHLKKLQRCYFFDAIEAIHIEYSYKYQLSQLNQLAKTTGFVLLENFIDSQGYFVDSLWQVKK